MKAFFLFSFLLFAIVDTRAQASDSLFVSGRQLYTSSGKLVSINEAINMNKNNKEVQLILTKANKLSICGTIASGAGGFLIGFPIGMALSGKKLYLLPMVIGAGLIGITVPLHSSENKKLHQAVTLYNQSLQKEPVDSLQ